MSTTQLRFVEFLNRYIVDTIQRKFEQQQLNPATMREIRSTIRTVIDGVFTKSDNYKLTETARAWLTNQYFRRLQVNDNQTMDDLIVINEYKLAQLSYSDIALLRDLYDQTDLADELNAEHRSRNAS